MERYRKAGLDKKINQRRDSLGEEVSRLNKKQEYSLEAGINKVYS